MSAALRNRVVAREEVVVVAAACICTCARDRPKGSCRSDVSAGCEAIIGSAGGLGATPVAIGAGLGLCRVCVGAVDRFTIWIPSL